MTLPPDDPLLSELTAWHGRGATSAAEPWSPKIRIPWAKPVIVGTIQHLNLLTPPRLIALHEAGGQTAIRALTRRELRRSVDLLGAIGPDRRPLLHRERLANDVLTVAREQLPPQDVARGLVPALFTTWPPSATVRGHATALFSATPPPWLHAVTRGALAPLIEAIWTTVQTLGPGAAIVAHGLPPQFWKGEWCAQVLRAGRGRGGTLELARTVLALGDGVPSLAQLDVGTTADAQELCRLARSPVTAALQEAVRTAVTAARRFDDVGQRDIANYAAQRVGDPFRGGVGWRDLEEERVQVRSWLAARFLRAFFERLNPAEAAYRCEERAQFWADYAGRVTSLVLFVGDDIRERLNEPDMRVMLRDLRGVVTVVRLQGKGRDGAALWMVLQEGDAALTVLEWNASGAMQCGPGADRPPSGPQSPATLRDAGGGWRETHQGDWQGRCRRALTYYNIHPTRA